MMPACDLHSETKFVFITGGVVSSLGKGIAAASIGRLLTSHGLRVAMVKVDPYLNVDPGTMSPYQHGEVFVTEDGGETDLDLGHYERFTSISCQRTSSVSSGQVYHTVISRERRGDYLGATIQVVPHIVDEIKRRILLAGQTGGADVVICEVGGTVGDIEGLPFLEALRQMRSDLGPRRTIFCHMTLVPHLGYAGELKTKPTQHSVQELRRIGIQPDVLMCRTSVPLGDDVRAKIALFASLGAEQVISCEDVASLYDVPLRYRDQGVDELILDHLRLPFGDLDLREWEHLADRVRAYADEDDPVRIAIVGKYVALEDAYLSVSEALRHAGFAAERAIDIAWVDAEQDDAALRDALRNVDGVLVPGGFGDRGVEGKIAAARYARERGIPFLGICLGMQVAVIEYARYVCGLPDANSAEFDPDGPDPVIDLLPEQKEAAGKGGTMRLGAGPVKLRDGSRVRDIYGEAVCYERHRHRFEVNNAYRRLLEQHGLVIGATTPDDRLVEMVELPADAHPFYIAAQAHPEFKSRPLQPAPLFAAFVDAAGLRAEAAQARRGELARDLVSGAIADRQRREDEGRERSL